MGTILNSQLKYAKNAHSDQTVAMEQWSVHAFQNIIWTFSPFLAENVGPTVCLAIHKLYVGIVMRDIILLKTLHVFNVG
jgi:hypothetical protein